MANEAPSTLFHADDYGITAEQAQDILGLSTACGGQGALRSVSIFANSPAFEAAVNLARPHVETDALHIGLHLNLVEGFPVSPVEEVPLLVNERGAFKNNFMGLLALASGPKRKQFKSQVHQECRAQLERFLSAFPEKRQALRADSHQHTHAIPAITHALVDAATELGCTFEYLRAPVEPMEPHKTARIVRNEKNPTAKSPRITPENRAKVILLNRLWNGKHGGASLNLPHKVFCGVALSAHMDEVDTALVESFERYAASKGMGTEFLFHPISVPLRQCLDPENEPFSHPCANAARDREAKTLVKLEH